MYTGLPKVCQKTKTTCFLRMVSVSLENDGHLSCVFFSVRSDKKGTRYAAWVGEHQHEWAMRGFWVYPTHACNWGELSRVYWVRYITCNEATPYYITHDATRHRFLAQSKINGTIFQPAIFRAYVSFREDSKDVAKNKLSWWP